MTLISLNTACLLAGVSKRTLWRRIAAGILPSSRGTPGLPFTRVELAEIAADYDIKLEPDDIVAIQQADSGHADAQNEVGILFLERELPEQALPWLLMAANQGYPEAMYNIGEAFISGIGIPPDPRQGLDWLRRSAIAGHPLAITLIEALRLRYPGLINP